jgi:hypothetical protein
MPSNSGQVRFVTGFVPCNFWLSEETYCILYCGLSNPTPEIDDVLRLPSDGSATLSVLDTALRRFISLCASYHGQLLRLPFLHLVPIMILSAEHYLHSPLQLEHACQLLLDSELFAFHSERMCELAIEDVQSVCGTMAIPVPHILHTSVENGSSRTIYVV